MACKALRDLFETVSQETIALWYFELASIFNSDFFLRMMLLQLVFNLVFSALTCISYPFHTFYRFCGDFPLGFLLLVFPKQKLQNQSLFSYKAERFSLPKQSQKSRSTEKLSYTRLIHKIDRYRNNFKYWDR